MWTDDGFVVRFPETDEPPDPALLLPASDEVEALVLRQLGGTALFAAKFRETAARALLLPKRRPGGRSPLWQQRKRAADLLAVASRFGSFPMLLETYRECLRDVFDMPALVDTLRRIESARDQGRRPSTPTIPSPFAASLLFSYVANYIYDGDAPLAERRAQALAVDQAQLRELLGDAELRELLDADALARGRARSCSSSIRRYHARSGRRRARPAAAARRSDAATRSRRAAAIDADAALAELLARAARASPCSIAGEPRFIAVEDAGRYRDALGVPLPPGLPESLLAAVARTPRSDLARRYARTHGPFTTARVRRALRPRPRDRGGAAEGAGRRRAGCSKASSGPAASGREWCDPDVLQSIRRRSLAKLRQEVEPVDPPVLGRLLTTWQGVVRRRAGLDALLDAIEQLQGAPLPASILETEILPARVEGYNPADLDALTAAGEVVWCGVEPLGERDGRLALYLTDHFARLRAAGRAGRARRRASRRSSRTSSANGASFFAALHEAAGGGYPGETVDALWDLVWKGVHHQRHVPRAARVHAPAAATRRAAASRPGAAFRSRRRRAAVGRRTLVAASAAARRQPVSPTEWSTATAQQLLARYGVVTREVAAAEGIAGGFSAVYDVLKAMEDAGRDPPRLLRRRRRRDAVRAAGRARAAALAARDAPSIRN